MYYSWARAVCSFPRKENILFCGKGKEKNYLTKVPLCLEIMPACFLIFWWKKKERKLLLRVMNEVGALCYTSTVISIWRKHSSYAGSALVSLPSPLEFFPENEISWHLVGPQRIHMERMISKYILQVMLGLSPLPASPTKSIPGPHWHVFHQFLALCQKALFS